ncbi:hypothetical protein HMPREF9370_0077 [Neisseria wadsworthii 9715]|uniref:Uncharacterized protein n=1 Tax=Neisseria wadsworthii 9715 TaxID=1030841 RepID=G4CLW8_9NEIS|nr:hypothetical protein HMPREF9370_0077 [Neisseria wadsworthii 9715]
MFFNNQAVFRQALQVALLYASVNVLSRAISRLINRIQFNKEI